MYLLTLCKKFITETRPLFEGKIDEKQEKQILDTIATNTEYVMLMDLVSQFDPKPLYISLRATVLHLSHKLNAFIARHETKKDNGQVMYNFKKQLELLGYK